MHDYVSALHRKLGHPSLPIMKQIVQGCNNFQKLNTVAYIPFCDSCQLGKMHKMHFSSTDIKTKTPLELVHTDLWGPSPLQTALGYKYYISFVDDFTRYTWIFPLKFKSEALEVFKCFKLQIEKQFQSQIKTLQSDWGEN